MRGDPTIASLYDEWECLVNTSSAKVSGKALLSICGPSGSGKTTIAAALSDKYPTYIESVVDNPHLRGLLESRGDFDAAGNQRWFLDRIHEFVKVASANSSLVLDQDPSAIVFAYAAVFLDENQINEVKYVTLLKELITIEERLAQWKRPRNILFLDAPARVLYQRVNHRLGGSHIPSIAWFEKVRDKFIALRTNFQQAVTLSTAECSPDEAISVARGLLGRSEN